MQPVIIYLVGQISADPRTYEWRQNIISWVEDVLDSKEEYWGLLQVIDPCGNTFNKSLITNHKNDEKNFSALAKETMPLAMLPALDLGYVKRSTMAIVNMNHYTPSRPILGSYFELAWYYALYPDKPVIGIFETDPKKDYQCNHPFVQAAVDIWVHSEQEAMDVITKQCFC
jgi:hypothetical protein